MKNSTFLLIKGEKYYSIGKKLCIVLIASIALLAATMLIAALVEGADAILDCLIFNISSRYAFVAIIIGMSYLGILLGAFGAKLYFQGLHLIGLGQIAENTDPK